MNVLILYFLAVRAFQYNEREQSSLKARSLADALGKPLLNAGCGGESWHFSAPAISRRSDVNMDIVPRNAPNFVMGDVQDMAMFSDKQFGVAFCSHVLEHVDNPEKALRELHRVADYVVFLTPGWWDLATYFNPDHKWVLKGDQWESLHRKEGYNMPRRDGTGPPQGAGGPRDGREGCVKDAKNS